MPIFLPGLDLCRTFYVEAVRPLLCHAFPTMVYAAARLGPGSEVLGYDSPRSVDHDWGPRLELFLPPGAGPEVSELLSARLPKEVRGWPTHFEPPGARVRVMAATTGPVAHRVTTTDVGTWTRGQLGFDARRDLRVRDWLAVPSQRLAEVTGGAVFHDGTGELTALRERLRWYPRDVWRHVLAAQWTRIAQEEAFVGRTAEAGDDLGSRLIAGRLARDVMRLFLLLERRYPPYQKWLGTAFAALPGVDPVAAALHEAVATGDPERRQAALCTAYEAAARRQNELGLAAPVDPRRRPYFDRPYPVIDAARFAEALAAAGRDTAPGEEAAATEEAAAGGRKADMGRAAAGRTTADTGEAVAGKEAAADHEAAGAGGEMSGAIDQFVDSTDVLSRPDTTRAILDATQRSAV
ncbi:DUF4037 domain-containing protein [Symbioplanes lichenis]|uniref:DUF4037 domain-containing protein n=1 Tax=Symbioplanes lichenis TaxID=1629072 RepID=UPI0027399547|nr:DUF4037 domain-containing protein [Actinoplanes lichenis]